MKVIEVVGARQITVCAEESQDGDARPVVFVPRRRLTQQQKHEQLRMRRWLEDIRFAKRLPTLLRSAELAGRR